MSMSCAHALTSFLLPQILVCSQRSNHCCCCFNLDIMGNCGLANPGHFALWCTIRGSMQAESTCSWFCKTWFIWLRYYVWTGSFSKACGWAHLHYLSEDAFIRCRSLLSLQDASVLIYWVYPWIAAMWSICYMNRILCFCRILHSTWFATVLGNCHTLLEVQISENVAVLQRSSCATFMLLFFLLKKTH